MSISVINANRIDFDRKINWSSLGNVWVHNDEVGVNPTDEEFYRRSDNCEIIITKEIAMNENIIMNLPECVKLICEAGTGYNNIDLNACRNRGIKVANIPSYSEGAVASLVITFILTLSCGLISQQRELWGGELSSFQKGIPPKEHMEVEGKVLGLIGGTGNIGQRVTNIASSLGMKILISSRKVPSGNSQREDVEYTDSIEYLISKSDFISIHCPLNDETRNLINERTLKLMKPTAYLINTARGAIVNEEDLIDALKSNRIAGAALDVQKVEPPARDSLLYTLPNVIITPHIGWKRLETRQRAVEAVAVNIAKYNEGTPINIVS